VEALADKLGIPVAGVAALGVLVVVQLVLQAYALVDLWRRPRASVAGERRWLWLLVILFVSNAVGPILYLAVGRRPLPAAEPPPDEGRLPAGDRARAVADLLYGPRERQDAG